MIKHTLTIALATLGVLVLITGIGNWTNALDTDFIAYGQTGGGGRRRRRRWGNRGGYCDTCHPPDRRRLLRRRRDRLHDDYSGHQRQFGRRDVDDG